MTKILAAATSLTLACAVALMAPACSSASEDPADGGADATPPMDASTPVDAADGATSDATPTDGGACQPLPNPTGKPGFSYLPGPDGPDNWGKLTYPDAAVAYPECASTTVQQSPLALVTPPVSNPNDFALVDGKDLFWSATAAPRGLINSGYTWQVNFPAGNGSKLIAAGTDFALDQLHFHAPSEHTLDGKQFAMEMHVVHAATAGQPYAAAIAVMFEEGAENAELAKVWTRFNKCPQAAETPVSGLAIDLPKLLPASRAYIRYDGALTSPACAAVVKFHLLTVPITASKAQIDAFRTALGPTNRPTQPKLPTTQLDYFTP